MLNAADSEFTRIQIFNNIAVWNFFVYLSNLACNEIEPISRLVERFTVYGRGSLNSIQKDIYPLVNYTGIFAVNTYLYALFEGVFLMGIPSGLSEFDNRIDCPRRFYDHDMFYTARIMRDIIAKGILNQLSKIVLHYPE